MSEQLAEKTEFPTPKRLEEAWKKGQFARSAEIQTVVVLGGALSALLMTGAGMINEVMFAMAALLGHLHNLRITPETLPEQAAGGAQFLGSCVWPVLAATVFGGVAAGILQSRFRITPEALRVNWERLNPVEGFKRILTFKSAPTAMLALLKLSIVGGLTYGQVKSIAQDPIFFTAVDLAGIAGFMATSAFRIILRVSLALLLIAALDYAWQIWKTERDLMMTRQEVKDEAKNSEGDPLVKSRQRQMRLAASKRRMLSEVPLADVLITNPTHFAVALRYDRATMKAPVIVAKGARLFAQKIKEIARAHQVPVIENKPLARAMFKYGKVGGEIPAQLYAAVAEVLAWVYRINPYRYYRAQQQSSPAARK